MNTVFFHVGPHKTGTTALQKFFMDNRQALFRSNLVYPKRFQRIFGHHDFRQPLADKRLSAEDVAFFNPEPHDFLLSSEDFISLGKDSFEYLRNSLDNKRIVAIYTWRRASFKLYSIWQETVKHGGTESFFSYYHDHLARPAQSQMLSADLKVTALSHVFGKQNVRILDYDASAANNSLLQDFMAMIECPWQPDFVTPESNPNAVNKAMDITDIEIIRALNSIFLKHFNTHGSWVRNQYSQLFDELEQAGLTELKRVVVENTREIKVGNYFLDNRCEKVMTDKFSDNIFNYQPSSRIGTIRVAKDEWMFDKDAQKLLADMAHIIRVSEA